VSVAGQTARKCNGVMDFWITGLILLDVCICLHCYRRDRLGHVGDREGNSSLFLAADPSSLSYDAASEEDS